MDVGLESQQQEQSVSKEEQRTKRKHEETEDETENFDYVDKIIHEDYNQSFKQNKIKHPFPYISGYKNEWWCELQHRPKLNEYFEKGSKLYQEAGERGANRDLHCYLKFPHRRYLTFVGLIDVDETFFSKLPSTRLFRLLPEDFLHYFIPLQSFDHIVKNFDDLKRQIDEDSIARNVYTSDDVKVEIGEFTLESNIVKIIKEFYRYWKPYIAIDKDTELPTPLTLATLYADVQPPYECFHLQDWRGFDLEVPSERLTLVSETLSAKGSGGRQYVVFSPRCLAERIVSNFQRGQPDTFCELFREEYEVTCVPFDLDVTGPIARGCWNDVQQENEYVSECVDELRRRLNEQLQMFLQDDFDIGRWPLRIFRRRARYPDKLSLHLYQVLPSNISFKNIDHVRMLANRMIEEMKNRFRSFSSAGTLLGHWEYVVDGKKYESKAEEHHVFFHGPDGERLSRSKHVKPKFVSYIDSKIYRVNGSLRLPGCSKSKNMDDVLVSANKDIVVEDDIEGSLVHFPHRLGNDNVVGGRRKYPQHLQPFRGKRVLIEYEAAERIRRSYDKIDVNDDHVQQLRQAIEKAYETTVTKVKRIESELFFDTKLKKCPFAGSDHQHANQYFVYRGRKFPTLLRKCWHSACETRYEVTTVSCLAKS